MPNKTEPGNDQLAVSGYYEKLIRFLIEPFLENPQTSNWEGPNGAVTVLGAGINQPIEGIGFNSNPGALWHIEITADLDTSYIKKQNFAYRTKDWR